MEKITHREYIKTQQQIE